MGLSEDENGGHEDGAKRKETESTCEPSCTICGCASGPVVHLIQIGSIFLQTPRHLQRRRRNQALKYRSQIPHSSCEWHEVKGGRGLQVNFPAILVPPRGNPTDDLSGALGEVLLWLLQSYWRISLMVHFLSIMATVWTITVKMVTNKNGKPMDQIKTKCVVGRRCGEVWITCIHPSSGSISK